ncbi:hypothetical protein, partial [Escherichia coli]|uniref:hypothetical protein n=1 Tax=Escherichia coli TaxID=562 RepID=UPI0021E70137
FFAFFVFLCVVFGGVGFFELFLGVVKFVFALLFVFLKIIWVFYYLVKFLNFSATPCLRGVFL